MLVSTGGASGKPYHAFKHGACRDPRARAAMEAARRALDEPGIPPGDEAIAICEERRCADAGALPRQCLLPLRGDA